MKRLLLTILFGSLALFIIFALSFGLATLFTYYSKIAYTIFVSAFLLMVVMMLGHIVYEIIFKEEK